MDHPLIERILEFTIAVQQIPAPTFAEAQRAAFVHERFLAEGLSDVSMDQIGNVYGRLPGGESAPPLVVSAHTDTVFPESTNLSLVYSSKKIEGPGIGDNSLGVAGLFGLLWLLRQRSIILPGDLWLVANVGEEGLGDLRGMRAVVDRFGHRVLAYVILEGMALGQIYHRGLGVQRYRIAVQTAGGHSWVNYGRPSAIHELATMITHLTALPLPDEPRTTLNVGVIEGGTTVNSIAAEAHLDLDLRSEGVDVLARLSARVETLVSDANRSGVRVMAEIIGQRPAGEISPSHPLVRLAMRGLETQGIRPHLNVGSTDANIPLSRGLPAICVGLTTGGSAHTPGEYIHTRPLKQGMEHLVRLVNQIYYQGKDGLRV